MEEKTKNSAALTDEEMSKVSGGFPGLFPCPYGFTEKQFPSIMQDGMGDHCIGWYRCPDGRKNIYMCEMFCSDALEDESGMITSCVCACCGYECYTPIKWI